MKVDLRIVAGQFRGRKLSCEVAPGMRPTPQMVREALFSILGDAVPDRPFFDIFACSGVVGLEAISRGATSSVFIERDPKLAASIDQYAQRFGAGRRAQVIRIDAYRWADRWLAPSGPATVYVSPPFADFEQRPEMLVRLIAQIQSKLAPGSVLALQAERGLVSQELPDAGQWDERRYGRNMLLFWVKKYPEANGNSAVGGAGIDRESQHDLPE
jgi:16S rRNA (guanine(966)-N(2))-methyltransferase RsmD